MDVVFRMRLIKLKEDILSQLECKYIDYITKLLQQKQKISMEIEVMFDKKLQSIQEILYNQAVANSLDALIIQIANEINGKQSQMFDLQKILIQQQQPSTESEISAILSNEQNFQFNNDCDTKMNENENENNEISSVQPITNLPIFDLTPRCNSDINESQSTSNCSMTVSSVNNNNANDDNNDTICKTTNENNDENENFSKYHGKRGRVRKKKKSTRKRFTSLDYKEMEGKRKTKWKCVKCNKYFKQKQCLKSHIKRIHEQVDKPFICEIAIGCNKKFKTKYELKTHIRTHTGSKPYPCIYCCKRFATSSNRTQHIKTHHADTL